MRYYTLDDAGIPVVCSLEELGGWESRNYDRKKIGRTHVGKILVSTVFLGIDHGYDAEKPPVLFETMTFEASDYGSYPDQIQERYCTLADALAGHAAIVAQIEAQKPSK